jgi:hypothetical protein
VVARRIGDFHDAKDAVQEALAAASRQWPRDGIPDNPTAWLVTTATRRAIDAVRSDSARRERERRAIALEPPRSIALAAALRFSLRTGYKMSVPTRSWPSASYASSSNLRRKRSSPSTCGARAISSVASG